MAVWPVEATYLLNPPSSPVRIAGDSCQRGGSSLVTPTVSIDRLNSATALQITAILMLYIRDVVFKYFLIFLIFFLVLYFANLQSQLLVLGVIII